MGCPRKTERKNKQLHAFLLRRHDCRGQRIVQPGWGGGSRGETGFTVAAYLCEARSDDSLWVNGLLAVPEVGSELPVLRVLEPLG